MESNKKLVAGVDFGSSNLVMAVGSVDEQSGTVRIETLLSRPSDGIEMGQIMNVNNVCEVLCEMKREIEEELGIRIDEAYAGVSGTFIHYHSYSDHVFVSDNTNGIVSQTDVDALNDRMNRVTVQDGEVVMDRFPLNYVIDGRRETDKPVGAFSRQLSSTFAFIVGRKQPLSRIEMVFRNSGLRLAGLFANSVIVANAVLNADEKNDGAAVVDIGADSTDIAVLSGGLVRYAATIPMGGRAIDDDINKHGVAARYSEELKKQHGTALSELVPNNKGIKIPTSGKGFKTIMKRNLSAIIEARVMDIIDYVKTELKDSGYENKLPYGLVLTGGTAAIPDIDQLFARHTERDVRIAVATEGIDDESCAKIDSPEHSAVVALLSAGAAKGACAIEITGPGRSVRTEPKGDTPEAEPQSPASVSAGSPAVEPQTVKEQPKETAKGPRIGEATTFVPKTKPVPPVTPPRTIQPPKPPTAPAVPASEEEPTHQPAGTVVNERGNEFEKGGEEKRPENPKPKKRWMFGRFIDSLNGIFQDGADIGSFNDTSLNSVADDSQTRSERPKSSFHPKTKAELGNNFNVEGDDNEEV